MSKELKRVIKEMVLESAMTLLGKDLPENKKPWFGIEDVLRFRRVNTFLLLYKGYIFDEELVTEALYELYSEECDEIGETPNKREFKEWITEDVAIDLLEELIEQGSYEYVLDEE